MRSWASHPIRKDADLIRFVVLRLSLHDPVGMNVEVLHQFSHRVLTPMAASATFALRFRRARLLIVSPGSAGTACPLSGRNSTYRPVQISGASFLFPELLNVELDPFR
jgi:hypothetical protein